MAQLVKLQVRDGVAIVTLDAPPVNTLSDDVVNALSDAFGDIAEQSGIAAVVLVATGQMFSAGSDIRAFGQSATGLRLSALCDLIENCPRPVIAALHATALGGGAELALAAHYRLAVAEAAIGLPEVTLGLIPGAGGTQRLPRLTGAAGALDMLLGGRALAAGPAQKLGLIDGIIAGDVLTAATGFARKLITQSDGPRPTRLRRDRLTDGAVYLQAVTDRRAALGASHLNAPKRLVDCVEAALLLPFDAGQAYAATCLRDCLAHPQSRALRHIFVAERQVAKTLLGRSGGSFAVTPAGQAVVDLVLAALARAASALVAQGEAAARIDDAAMALGLRAGPFGGGDPATGTDLADLQRRLIAAMMAEGGRQIAQGAVADAGAVDALIVHGAGFQRWRGGPMAAAQAFGLLELRAEMDQWTADDPVWTPPPVMIEALKYADGFDAPELR